MTKKWMHRFLRNEASTQRHRNRELRKLRKRRVLLQSLERRRLLAGDLIAMESTSSPNIPVEITSGPVSMSMVGDASMDTTSHHQMAHPAAMALISLDQATHTVVTSGNWSDPSVWSNGVLPTTGARIVIPEGMTVTVDGVLTSEFKTIGIHGTLRFATDVDTELRVGTIVSAPKGRFEMGTVNTPVSADVNAKVVFADDGAIDRTWDPEQLSRGAVLQGPTEIHGAMTTHQLKLARHPVAGDTSIQLEGVPVNWSVGDEIVITGTQGSTSDEVRTITGLDGSTITLHAPLDLDHVPPRADLNVYAANASRNVEFSSENAATDRRGHVMFMHTLDVNVNHAEFTDLGRTDKKIPLDDTNFEFNEGAVGNRTSAGVVFTTTPGDQNNVRGRYPVHFHRGGTNPASTPAVVNGSVVMGSPGYGFVNHSSNVTMKNNVSYDVHGSAYYTEAGDEIGTIENNIAIRTVNPDFRLEENGEISVDLRDDVQDFGVDGDAFWLSGHLVSLKNNIASGASGHGIILWTDGLVEADRGRATVRTSDIANGHLIPNRETIPTWWAPLAEISNNEASNATIGFRTRYIHSSIYLGDIGSPFHEPPPQEYIDTLRPTIDGLTVWGSRDGALLNYSERLSLKNAEIIGVGAPYVRQDGTTDLGVGIDMYNAVSRGPGVVENVTVEGFNMGILVPRHDDWQMSNVHLRNTTDLHIEQATMAERTLDMTNVTFGDLVGTAVAGREGQRQNVVMQANDVGEQPFWFLMTDQISLNGQGLYFNEQAANHVPLTQERHGDSRAPVPTEFIGLTNQQLQDRYGSSFGGEITPPAAQSTPWLTGGVVGTVAVPGEADPPLYDMRDGDTFNLVSSGTLTNFDPSQLDDGVPVGDDDDENPEDGSNDDDESDEDSDTDGEEDDEGDDSETDGDDESDEDSDTDGEDDGEGDDSETDGDDDESDEDSDTDGEDDDEGDDSETDGDDDESDEDSDTDGEDDDEGDDSETDGDDDESDEDSDTDGEDDDEGDDSETDGGDDESDEDSDTDGEDDDEGDDSETDGDDDESDEDSDTDGEDDDEGDDSETDGDDDESDEDSDIDGEDDDEGDDSETDGDDDFHNENSPTDVNNDGATTALDALLILNVLVRQGPGFLQTLAAALQHFIDVNNDGSVSAVDALQVINNLVVGREDDSRASAVDAALASPRPGEDDEEEEDDDLLTLLAQ